MFYFGLACRLIIGSVFLSAVLGKVHSRESRHSLVSSVAEIPIVPRRLAPVLILTIMGAEVALVGLLVPSATAPFGLAGASALLAVFTGYLIWLQRNRGEAACRCFGTPNRRLLLAPVMRNILLLGVCAAGLAAVLLAEA